MSCRKDLVGDLSEIGDGRLLPTSRVKGGSRGLSLEVDREDLIRFRVVDRFAEDLFRGIVSL
jgi:hypothetical protein